MRKLPNAAADGQCRYIDYRDGLSARDQSVEINFRKEGEENQNSWHNLGRVPQVGEYIRAPRPSDGEASRIFQVVCVIHEARDMDTVAEVWVDWVCDHQAQLPEFRSLDGMLSQ